MTKSKTKIVLTGGCFDIFHYGHLYFLKKAGSLGNYLIVAIESDKRVRKLKGPGRPVHSQKQRKEILESLNFVDKVIVLKDNMSDKDYQEFVARIRPDIIAVTEGDAFIEKKRSHAEKVGAKVVVISKIKNYSTSAIARSLSPLEANGVFLELQKEE